MDIQSQFPPVLDVPPPLLTRRRVLGAAAVGVTTVALPSAFASASVAETAPDAFTYAGDGVISYWTPFNTSSADYASNGGVAATSVSLDLNGRLTRGGTTQSINNLNPADPEISTDGGDATRSDFKIRNSSNVLDLVTSPHLQFSLSVNNGTANLATFVLYSVRQMSASPTANLAFYVSTNNFASATLRRTAALVQGNRHLVVNLGLLGSYTAGATVSVRVYPYSTPTSPDLRFSRFNSDPAPTPLVSPQDTVNESVVGSRIGAATSHMAAFVGRFTGPV